MFFLASLLYGQTLVNYTWVEVSTLEVTVCKAFHLFLGISKLPNLELKTQPKNDLVLSHYILLS